MKHAAMAPSLPSNDAETMIVDAQRSNPSLSINQLIMDEGRQALVDPEAVKLYRQLLRAIGLVSTVASKAVQKRIDDGELKDPEAVASATAEEMMNAMSTAAPATFILINNNIQEKHYHEEQSTFNIKVIQDAIKVAITAGRSSSATDEILERATAVLEVLVNSLQKDTKNKNYKFDSTPIIEQYENVGWQAEYTLVTYEASAALHEVVQTCSKNKIVDVAVKTRSTSFKFVPDDVESMWAAADNSTRVLAENLISVIVRNSRVL